MRYPGLVPTSSVVSRHTHAGCWEPSALGEEGPWWSAVAPGFLNEPEAFQLGRADRAVVGATAGVDVVLRTLGACLVGALAFPIGFHPRALRRALEDKKVYGPLAESRDPDAFFVRPPTGVRIESQPARRPLFSPRDGVCEDLSFESPFVPFNRRLRDSYARHTRNRTAHVRYWRHRGSEPRPTIVAIHGFSADLYHLNEWLFALPWLHRLGCNVLLFTLPFHGRRQSRLSPFSGHGFFAGGPAHINEAFAHAVFDFRILMDWLSGRPEVEQVGVMGVSLGGFTASLLAAVEPRLAFSVPNVPVVSIPDLVMDWEPIGVMMRGALKATRQGVEEARYLLAASSPLTYTPRIPTERLMIIGGIGDRLAPPRHSRLLWEHWDRCRMHWFVGSHLLHLDRGNYLRETKAFLREIGFLTPGHITS